MNRAVELLETPDSRCPELEDYASSSLSDDVSIAAFDDLGEMVGVVVNGVVTREVGKRFCELNNYKVCYQKRSLINFQLYFFLLSNMSTFSNRYIASQIALGNIFKIKFAFLFRIASLKKTSWLTVT